MAKPVVFRNGGQLWLAAVGVRPPVTFIAQEQQRLIVTRMAHLTELEQRDGTTKRTVIIRHPKQKSTETRTKIEPHPLV